MKLSLLKNYADDLKLLGYCLMPNHYHLIVRQQKPYAVSRFMNSLWTRFVMYFNRKCIRI